MGLPCGSADVDFGPDETFQNPNISLDELFNRKLCNIVGRVIERNQSESPQVYATTQNIDEQLEQLHNDMPKSWWEIPAFIPNDNSLEAVQIFNRIMSEMCKSFVSYNSSVRASKYELVLRYFASPHLNPHNIVRGGLCTPKNNLPQVQLYSPQNLTNLSVVRVLCKAPISPGVILFFASAI